MTTPNPSIPTPEPRHGLSGAQVLLLILALIVGLPMLSCVLTMLVAEAGMWLGR